MSAAGGDGPAPRGTRPCVVLGGFEREPARRILRALRPRARVAQAAGDDALVAQVRAGHADVVCLGPGLSGAAARALVERLIGAAPAMAPRLLVLCAGDPRLFQDCVDRDQIYYLAREPPPEDDIIGLLRGALNGAGVSPRPAALAAGDDGAERARALARRLSWLDDPGERAELLETTVCEELHAARAGLRLYDPLQDVLVARDTGAGAQGHSAAAGLLAFALRSGGGVSVDSVGRDPRYDREADDPAGTGGEPLAVVPLEHPGGAPGGVLVAVRAPGARPFDAAELARLGRLARAAAPFVLPSDGATPGAHPLIGSASPFRAAALARHAAASTPEREPLRAPSAGLRAVARELRALARGLTWPWRGRSRLPFVAQSTPVDCGCACLAMVLAHHGREVPLERVRALAGLSREAATARVLIETARRFGLRGRGVQLEGLDELGRLEPGSILHWRFAHFVVLEGMTRDGAWVLDPALGRRHVARAELDRSFTGVALVFEPGEEFERARARPPRLARLRRVLSGEGRVAAGVLATSLLVQLLALCVPLVTGVVVDRVVPSGGYGLLGLLALGLTALTAFQLLAAASRALLLLRLRTRLDARLAGDFVDHLVELPFLFFQQRTAGDLLMRLNSHTLIRDLLAAGSLAALLDALMVATYLGLLFWAHPRFALAAAGLGGLRVLLFALTRRRYEELTTRALEAQADANGYEAELLAGIETLKAAGAERRAVEHWSHLFTRQLNAGVEQGRLDGAVRALLELFGTMSPLVLLLYGARLVLAGELTLGAMLALCALAGGFLAPLTTLVASAYQWQLAASYLARIEDVMQTPRERSGERVLVPLRGALELRAVSFRYGALAPLVLEDVSAVVRPGQMVAVVGRSGSGKSTLAALLAGLVRPTAGQVLYDGVDLEQLELRALRGQLGFVAQRSYLFGLSVRANIALSDPEASLERVVAAARLAAIHDDVAALALGYDTLIADGGASLSGGQRQRLALARALLGRPRVLVLDEATSALDALTEARVFDNLRRLDATRIVIAHRLSTVRHADLILVLEAGRLAAAGTHDELMARSTVYRELVEAQVEPARPGTA